MSPSPDPNLRAQTLLRELETRQYQAWQASETARWQARAQLQSLLAQLARQGSQGGGAPPGLRRSLARLQTLMEQAFDSRDQFLRDIQAIHQLKQQPKPRAGGPVGHDGVCDGMDCWASKPCGSRAVGIVGIEIHNARARPRAQAPKPGQNKSLEKTASRSPHTHQSQHT